MAPTVVLILGGFTIATALHKYQLDARLVSSIASFEHMLRAREPCSTCHNATVIAGLRD